jgi:PAS domain S-box-containing protein
MASVDTSADPVSRGAQELRGKPGGVSTSRDFPDSAHRALVAAAPDGVIVVGADGRIVLANPEIARLTGYTQEELIGQPVELLVPVGHRGRHVGHRDGFVRDPHSRPMGSNLRLSAHRKDGGLLPVEIMLAPMKLDSGPATIAFVRDATDRRRREVELEDANMSATIANRELEAFSYSVAHDLRAPLRSIDGFAHALLEDNGDQLDDSGKDYLARVRSNAQRMGELIDDLLALARLSRSELRRERVDLGRLARESEARLRLENADRQVELTIDDGLVVQADARMLAIAIENLVGNAWKFTRGRTPAHVHVGRTPGDGPPSYFVRDDGVGFDMAHASHLFAPFKRLHGIRDFEGTGIGLATVARVIHRHGGRIWADAAPGAGATFTFTLGLEDAR